MRYSEARGTLIYEKNLKSKISCQTPFKEPRNLFQGIDSKEPIPLSNVAWARICKRLRSFRTI